MSNDRQGSDGAQADDSPGTGTGPESESDTQQRRRNRTRPEDGSQSRSDQTGPPRETRQRQQRGQEGSRPVGGNGPPSGPPGGHSGSTTDILGDPDGKQFMTYIVAIFAAVGLGYGVGLILLDAFASDGAEVLGALAMFIPVLGAPIIAMATGLLTGLQLEAPEKSAALISGVGAFFGFLVLVVVLIVFTALVFDGNGDGNGDDDLSEFFGGLLGFGGGVGVAGAVSTYVVKQMEL